MALTEKQALRLYVVVRLRPDNTCTMGVTQRPSEPRTKGKGKEAAGVQGRMPISPFLPLLASLFSLLVAISLIIVISL